MKQNACYFCRIAAKAAWRELTDVLNGHVGVGEYDAEYYRTLLLLAYRVNSQEGHSRAGHILQGLTLVPNRRLYFLRWARVIEIDEPVSYPKYLDQILVALNRKQKTKFTNEDFKRYAPYLDA